jgi:hypothetical protein
MARARHDDETLSLLEPDSCSSSGPS